MGVFNYNYRLSCPQASKQEMSPQLGDHNYYFNKPKDYKAT